MKGREAVVVAQALEALVAALVASAVAETLDRVAPLPVAAHCFVVFLHIHARVRAEVVALVVPGARGAGEPVATRTRTPLSHARYRARTSTGWMVAPCT